MSQFVLPGGEICKSFLRLLRALFITKQYVVYEKSIFYYMNPYNIVKAAGVRGHVQSASRRTQQNARRASTFDGFMKIFNTTQYILFHQYFLKRLNICRVFNLL